MAAESVLGDTVYSACKFMCIPFKKKTLVTVYWSFKILYMAVQACLHLQVHCGTVYFERHPNTLPLCTAVHHTVQCVLQCSTKNAASPIISCIQVQCTIEHECLCCSARHGPLKWWSTPKKIYFKLKSSSYSYCNCWLLIVGHLESSDVGTHS